MNDELISKQALIDEILEDGNGAVLSYPTGVYEDELVEHIEKQMIEYFIKVVNYMPPVESEQPKGEWIDMQGNQLKIGGYSGYCSVCHEWSEYLTDYCGKCNACMVKENE